RLPAYMVPASFLVVDGLPRTASGKVDRRALPVAEARAADGDSFAAPQTDLEKQIAGIWQEVVHAERVGLDDNFFDAGGNSLLLARLHHRLEVALGRRFPMVALLQHTTVRKQAQALTVSAAEAERQALAAA